MGNEPHPLDIPVFLRRDANNIAEFMRMSIEEAEAIEAKVKKAASKANGAKAPAKVTSKPKVKAETAKPAKAKKAAPKAPKRLQRLKSRQRPR